jgi:predicted dehydrogenase/threonine dehydrogenase-like Zn-dependent dehydrogenase
VRQVLLLKGQAVVDEVPAPLVEPGTILVRTVCSCISTGTELSGLRSTSMPLWKRALKNPDKLKKAVAMMASQGFSSVWNNVQGKLAAGSPTGYSAAGVVLEVGAGIDDLEPGDRVACAGAQCAHHAEILRVPRNLAVVIPEGLDWQQACTATLGAIALQGVRRAQPTLGENFVVLGLGILGQLTTQLLKANGCRTIGLDLDHSRIKLALSLGLDVGVTSGEHDEIQQVARLTDGLGADGVIITAATPSDSVVSTAFRLCRRKGRVILVGDVGLQLNRADFYEKEIDFLISTSYGPGRYDRNYEERGLDYPAAYVRWTENRNLREFLNLVSEEKIRVLPLISGSSPISDAPKVYSQIQSGIGKHMMMMLTYPQSDLSAPIVRKIQNPLALAPRTGRIRIAIAGAGGFAKGMHLPNLRQLEQRYEIGAVVSRTGHNATATARQYGAAYASTDFLEVLADKDITAVLIATRHDLHAQMAIKALEAGKHVLLEKPLALNPIELKTIETFYKEGVLRQPVLLTGFNRRFAPHIQKIAQWVKGRTNPLMINYRMNAGYIPLDGWVHGPEGGGRNIGEACHIYDLFTFLTASRVKQVRTQAIRPATGYYSRHDNFMVSLEFECGSIASLTYTALGSSRYSKEMMDVYFDGKVASLRDFEQAILTSTRAQTFQTTSQDKGQKAELIAFADCIQHGAEWPIPLWQQVQATRISFEVEDALRNS